MSGGTPMDEASRRRLAALAALALTIAAGLASRRWPAALPAAAGKYPGDALWALAVALGWRALRLRARTRDIALLALATSVGVEFAKLWQAPWLVQLRHTTLGHLLLGQVFSWQNFVAYGVGVLAGAALDRRLVRPTSASTVA